MYLASSKSQKQLPIVAKESLALAGLALLYPFGMSRARLLPKRTGIERDQTIDAQTIVLVHGLAANRSCFYPLKSYLKIHGVENIVSFEYRSRDGVEHAARQLGQFVKRHAQSKRICFVGHSLGGVVAQAYIQMLGGHRKASRLISIGSPHQGTYNAYWLASKIGLQLRPDSSLCERLNRSMDIANHVSYYSITAESDNLILPRESAQQWETHCIAGIGHLGLLLSPTVMNLVLRLVQDADS